MAMREHANGGFDRLLVPLDGSLLAEQAIPYARALARPGTVVTLVEVVPDPASLSGPLVTGGLSSEETLRLDREAAAAYLEAVAASLRSTTGDLDVQTTVAVGDAAVEILNTAHCSEADVIVMASHGRGTFGRFAYGSVADRAARTADVPVLIVRATEHELALAPGSIRRLLLPLDGSTRAARALPVAASLAKWLHVPVHVVFVVDLARAAAMTISPQAFGAILIGLQDTAKQTVASATATLREQEVTVSSEVLEGSAAVKIADAVRPGDLIVMTSHGRGGVVRWLLGSVAEKLVREGSAPVLLLRANRE